MDNTSGLKTALDLEAKSSGGEREKAEISKNFSLPLLPPVDKSGVAAETVSSGAVVEPVSSATIDDEYDDPDCDYMQSRLRGRRGRPAGSRNKSTEKWRSYFLRQNKSPLMFLGSIFSQATDELAAELHLAKEDALKYQISAATAVLPYVHQKLPIELKAEDNQLPVLNIFMNKNEFNLTTDSTGKLKDQYKKVELVDDTEFKDILESDKTAQYLNKTNT